MADGATPNASVDSVLDSEAADLANIIIADLQAALYDDKHISVRSENRYMRVEMTDAGCDYLRSIIGPMLRGRLLMQRANGELAGSKATQRIYTT